MAKAVGFIGTITGKAGNLVFAVWKGIQVMKAYNPNPVNPRTPQQVAHRLRFDSCVQYGIAMNRWDILKDIWKRITPNQMSPYNRMVQEQLLDGNFICTGDDINVLPTNGFIAAIPDGNVNPVTVGGTCLDGVWSAISHINGSGCGEDANGFLMLKVYNSNLLPDPDQAPFRDVRICMDYNTSVDFPVAISPDYIAFDVCCPSCGVVECCSYAVIFIPLYMNNVGVTGVMPLIEDIDFVGEPTILCYTLP